MKKYLCIISLILFPMISFTEEEVNDKSKNSVVEEVEKTEKVVEKKVRTNNYTLNLKFDKYLKYTLFIIHLLLHYVLQNSTE